MSEYLLSTRGLSKKYGGKFALKDISAHIKRGEIYGLIGRNGAGKTTLLKIVTRQIHATLGDVLVEGASVKSGKCGMLMGALVETPSMYPDCTAEENLIYKCIALDIKDRKKHIKELLEQVELASTGKKKTRQFSLGMKQRLGLALALVGRPQMLLLDEPINGMDPQGIAGIREMLIRLNREEGTTIIISSHILDELAKFATSYGIIKDGELLKEFSRDDLAGASLSSIVIRSPEMPRVLDALKNKMDLDTLKPGEDGALILRDSVGNHRVISRLLFDEGIYVEEFSVRQRSLEDYFMLLTGGAEHA